MFVSPALPAAPDVTPVKRRVVVTGATGFLGGRLCAHLKALGFEVGGLGRNEDKGQALRALGVSFDSVELSDTVNLTSLSGADVFVHAAALSSAWGPRAEFERSNITGTLNALKMAERLGAKRFIFISSPSIYFQFKDQLNVHEKSALPVPINDYAATKIIAEDIVRSSRLDTIILRPRGIYGPGDASLLPRLLRAAKARPLPRLRKGAAVTDLTFVDDAVCAIVAAINAPPEVSGRVYNISGGEALPVSDIILKAGQLTGTNIRFKDVSVTVALAAARTAEAYSRLWGGKSEPIITAYGIGLLAYSQTLDISAARAELGYRPQVSFDEGLKRTFGHAPFQ